MQFPKLSHPSEAIPSSMQPPGPQPSNACSSMHCVRCAGERQQRDAECEAMRDDTGRGARAARTDAAACSRHARMHAGVMRRRRCGMQQGQCGRPCERVRGACEAACGQRARWCAERRTGFGRRKFRLPKETTGRRKQPGRTSPAQVISSVS